MRHHRLESSQSCSQVNKSVALAKRSTSATYFVAFEKDDMLETGRTECRAERNDPE